MKPIIHKKIITSIIILLFFIGICSSLFLYFSEFDYKNLFLEIDLTIYHKILIVLLLFFFRNYLLIPSTILILFTSYFLENFFLTLIISTIWVGIGIFQTYFVGYVFSEDVKNNKHYHKIEHYNNKIQEKWFTVIFFWALFPIIPVDLLYYSAWFVKYSPVFTFLAWVIWEFPLIILYSYLWEKAHSYEKYFLLVWLLIVLLLSLYYWLKKYLGKKG